MPAHMVLAKIKSEDAAIEGTTYLARIERATGDIDYMIVPVAHQIACAERTGKPSSPGALFTVEMIGRVVGVFHRER